MRYAVFPPSHLHYFISPKNFPLQPIIGTNQPTIKFINNTAQPQIIEFFLKNDNPTDNGISFVYLSLLLTSRVAYPTIIVKISVGWTIKKESYPVASQAKRRIIPVYSADSSP